jgi:alpha-L-rhamnosidase
VPANSFATVYLPSTDVSKISESGAPLNKAVGIIGTSSENGQTAVRVGSGTYVFQLKL